MTDALQHAIGTLIAGRDLSADEMTRALAIVMDGEASDVGVTALLTALACKGETAAEIAGAARALRERVTRVPARTAGLLDTCGTGGDRQCTFNISTATALVVAACGVPVAKHGNRSATSSSGSAEVLEALGVDLSLSPQQVAESIDQVGIGFCYARLLHSAMKHVAPVRGQLGFRTLFNLLGPLTNPAGAEFQLIGASRNDIAERMAGAIARLGTRRTLVVCGNNELDELALWGRSILFDVTGDGIRKLSLTPGELGLSTCSVDQLRVDSPEQSADVIRRILQGDAGPHRDIVVVNAAAALWCAGRAQDLADGIKLAANVIDSGRARDLLHALVDWTRTAAT